MGKSKAIFKTNEWFRKRVLWVMLLGLSDKNSYFSRDTLSIDVFKNIYFLVSEFIKTTYFVQYANLDIEYCVSFSPSRFEFVECLKCGFVCSSEKYNTMLEPLERMALNNKTLAGGSRYAYGCGYEAGPCDLCLKCNKLFFVPETYVYYCQNHAKDMLFNERKKFFCNNYKRDGRAYIKVGSNINLIERLDEESVEVTESFDEREYASEWEDYKLLSPRLFSDYDTSDTEFSEPDLFKNKSRKIEELSQSDYDDDDDEE